MKHILFLLTIISFLYSCGSKVEFEKEYTIKNNVWTPEKIMNFKFNVADNSKNYDVFFTMRNSENYRTANIWLYVTTSAPSGNSITDTLEYFVADPKGLWIGQSDGDFVKNKFIYKSNIKFKEKGKYSISVTQGMRKKDTPKVSNFGIIVKQK